MARHSSPTSIWSTIRWIEIFFVLGLPLTLATVAAAGHEAAKLRIGHSSFVTAIAQPRADQTIDSLQVAAETARRAGDPLRAAHTYLDAATVALDRGDRQHAAILLHHAQRLARDLARAPAISMRATASTSRVTDHSDG
ncbi:MAG: hypothetical protein P8099_11255 [Gemmatimonadota bacterium]|jgi:hypothetical protein